MPQSGGGGASCEGMGILPPLSAPVSVTGSSFQLSVPPQLLTRSYPGPSENKGEKGKAPRRAASFHRFPETLGSLQGN